MWFYIGACLQAGNSIQQKKRQERSQNIKNIDEKDRETQASLLLPDDINTKATTGLGKNRRNTLRKQVERIKSRIEVLNKFNEVDTQVDKTSESESALDTADNFNANTAAQSVDEEAAAHLVNPKSRGGWGFWRT